MPLKWFSRCFNLIPLTIMTRLLICKEKRCLKNWMEVERRYEALYHLLGQPEVIGKQEELQRSAKEYSELGKVVDLYRKLKKLEGEIKRASTS